MSLASGPLQPRSTGQKWGVACAPCSLAKAKCLRSNSAPGAQCDRCQRLGKECAARSQKTRKKRQNKPSRTAELEQRLNSLIAQLQPSGHGSPPSRTSLANSLSSQTITDPSEDTPASSPQTFGDRCGTIHEPVSLPVNPEDLPHKGPTTIPRTYNSHGPTRCFCRPAPGDAPGPLDDDETLLRLYREKLMPTYPFVVIPQYMTAAALEAERPFLMACIRMVASFRSLRSMQGQLYQLMAYISDHMLIRSERSLDLLSGIVVILSWHNFHCFLHSQLQNLTSLAMTLVAELSLKRPPSWQERTRLMVVNLGTVRERTNEERRLLLAVWHLSSCVSVGFQQLDSMRFSPYMQQCLRELEKAEEYASDAYLVHFVKMQHLSERITELGERCDAEMQSESTSKAPISGYVFALQAELDKLRVSMPHNLKSNNLIELQMNTVGLRLHEPPRIDAALLTSISKSFTTSTPFSGGTSSPLDAFYRSHAALKTYLDNFLDSPVSSIYCIPLPISVNMIYVMITLSRWAMLFNPGVQFPPTPQPPDPSGSYSNPSNDPPTPVSTAFHDSPSSVGSNKVAQALETLKTQLATQPSLAIDAPGVISRVSEKFEAAGAMMAAHNPVSQEREGNMWILKAAKLRIAQFKLQQWVEKAEEENDGEEEEGSGEGDEAMSGGGLNVPDPGASTMEFSGDQVMDLGMPGTEDLYRSMDGFMWTSDWDDWEVSFDPFGLFPQ